MILLVAKFWILHDTACVIELGLIAEAMRIGTTAAAARSNALENLVTLVLKLNKSMPSLTVHC